MRGFSRGAEWRKWDLHFHTPSSYDYKNKAVTNAEIINGLVSNQIEVVAITDHHVIDIERIEKLQQLGKQNSIEVLPGIEFLSDARGRQPIHFIGIFSQDCKLSHIWGQLKHKTNISKIESEGQNPNQVYCDLIDTINLVHELGGVVSIYSGGKHGSIEQITHSLEHGAAQKTEIAHNVDIYELGNSDDQIGYHKFVFPSIGKVIPMIICSDNHDIKNFTLKDNLWIKADPNFDGLKQVINEPEERIYIGDKPPLIDRVATNRTKYIKELTISQVEDYNGNQGVWFDNVKIPLNSELVAIIGNKGSGKSAIADILSLCANYHDIEDFSFLKSNKFCEKSGRVAKKFEAQLTWESESTDKKNLYETPQPTEISSVKYLPQGKFERLTNEISTVKDFQKEIESVVFSHIPEEERLGAKTFSALIEEKSSTVESQIEALKDDIEIINKQIIELERRSTGSYQTELNNKLNKKQEELDALVEPPKVSDPNEDPEKKKQNEAVNNKISAIKKEITEIEVRIESAVLNKKTALEILQKLKRIKTEVQQKQTDVTRFVDEKKSELSEFDFDLNKLISIKVDFTELDKVIAVKEKDLIAAKELIGEAEDSTEGIKPLTELIEEKKAALKVETSKLNTEQKLYQEYLNSKVNWEKERAKIIGSIETVDTFAYIQNELTYLNEKLAIDLDEKYEERRGIIKRIFDQKQEVIAVYKDARNRLNSIIEANSKTLKDYKISVDASLVKQTDFIDKFLGFIDKVKVGSFHSKDGGEAQLKKLQEDFDFDQKDNVITFLDNVVDALKKDKRSGQDEASRAIADQVKDISGLYRYLFSLEFLENNYQLKQGEKQLEQLSPGERGALLLVFYLLLDKNDIPLIIDQPEDNLDNHSVATVLVPFIQAAKKKRQIIMVTHNPNLAVVSDAEQIIYVNLDKQDNYKFTTVSGSIENRNVNEKIVKVLEGAMPAFNNRKNKYFDE